MSGSTKIILEAKKKKGGGNKYKRTHREDALIHISILFRA